LPKKLAIRDKIKPLGSQRVGLENKQPGVTCLGHFIVPFGMGKLVSTCATASKRIGRSSYWK